MDRLSYHSDDERRAFCKKHGIDPAQHCCLNMAWFISQPVEWESQGPNPVIVWFKSWNEYRINIPREGHATTLIRYCPWCASRLPESLQGKWYATLTAMGFSDPGEDDIPPEFDSDAWWRLAEGK